MDFIAYTNAWAKTEVVQGRIMIGIGLLLLVVLIGIFRSGNELLNGTIIPLSLLFLILVGYGGYILYSRPAYAEESIALYEESKEEGIASSKAKHTEDNKTGKTLLRFVYPVLMILSAISLIINLSTYIKGMALGFVLVYVTTYIIDNGFISRSEAFLTFLNDYTP